MLKNSYFIHIIIFFFYAYLVFTLFLNFYDKKEGFTQKKLMGKKNMHMQDVLAEPLD